MKKTQLTDALRNIKTQRVSFLSIVIIIAIGTGVFLGCFFSAKALRRKANEVDRLTSYHDLEIKATAGISEEDVLAVRKKEGVKDAEGIFSLDMYMEGNEELFAVHVISKTEQLDQPAYINGTAPASAADCVIVKDLADRYGLSTGDKVRIYGRTEDLSFLKGEHFTITGIVNHPENFRNDATAVPEVLISPEAVDTDKLHSPYTGMIVRFHTEKDRDVFSEDYMDTITKHMRDFRVLGQEREQLKHADLIREANKEIEDGENKLASAKEQLDAAQKEIEENEKKLADADAQIASAEKELADGKKELAENEKKLQDAKGQLDAAKPELDKNERILKDARKKLDEAQAELDAGYDKLMDADAVLSASKEELDKTEAYLDYASEALDKAEKLLTDGNGKATIEFDGKKFEADWNVYNDLVTAYNHFIDEWNCAQDEYEAGVREYNAGVDEYEAASAEFLAKEKEYEDGLKLFNEKKEEYEKGLKDYENGLKEYKKAEKELRDGEAELEEKKKELQEGYESLRSAKKEFEEKKKEYEEGKKKLEEVKKKIEEIPDGRWIQMSRMTNLSWSEFRDVANTFNMLAYTFAVMFILLSMLVCYSTLGRIISEQRKLVGTTKALGFKKSEILIKYLIFGIFGAILGALGGILVSNLILEPLIIGSVEKTYTLGKIATYFSVPPALISFAGSVVVAILATWVACRKLLAEQATKLISGETSAVHRNKAKGDRDGSLYIALILRNITTDMKRVIITVVSIGGSCMLLIIGFSLKQSYEEVIVRQFDEIIKYDGYVEFQPDDEDIHVRDIRKTIADAGAKSLPVYMTGTMSECNGREEAIQLTAADPQLLKEYLSLKDISPDKTEFTLPKEGAVIFQRYAEIMDLKIGDSLSIMDGSGVYHEVPVSGICTCYAGRMVCMSASYARELFQDQAKENFCLIKYEDNEEADLKRTLSRVDGFVGFTDVEQLIEVYRNASNLMNLVIIALIIIAGIMAAFIQLNLVKIQVYSKKREMTIMRVNGFTVKETVGYLVRENVLTCAAGIVLGFLLGFLASKLVLRILDRIELMMIRDFMGMPFVYAALITILFTIIVNWLELRKVKDLKLVDAAA